jgi:ABC-type spermidine/putrescine transport system permease subunit I
VSLERIDPSLMEAARDLEPVPPARVILRSRHRDPVGIVLVFIPIMGST